MGVENVCLVAVSVYGQDNRSMFDAMRRLGSRCRAVVCLDPSTITEQELDDMHKIGVRGVRINLKTKGELPPKEVLVACLAAHAARIRSRGWLIQLYLALEQVPLISEIIPTLGVRVVLDHMASPDPDREASSQHGYRELLDLLRRGQVWVKISGTYRFASLPDLDVFAKSVIRAGPKNVVWASDWPHTGGPVKRVNGSWISTFRDVHDMAFVRQCFEWCDNDPVLIQDLFVNNPGRLWLD